MFHAWELNIVIGLDTENIETAWPLRFQFVRTKLILHSPKILYVTYSNFKTPKQVKANFGQNQMANETYSLRKFWFFKNMVDFLQKTPGSFQFCVRV